MSSALPTVSKGLPFDLDLELRIIVGVIDASPGRNRHSLFRDGLATNERIVRMSWLLVFLGWGASWDVLLAIIGEVIVLFVLRISCSDGCIIDFLLGEIVLSCLDGGIWWVSPWLHHLNSIHNWNIYYFKYTQHSLLHINCLGYKPS